VLYFVLLVACSVLAQCFCHASKINRATSSKHSIPITQFASFTIVLSHPLFAFASVFRESQLFLGEYCSPPWFYNAAAQGESSLRLANKACLSCPSGFAANAPDLQVDVACLPCAAGTSKNGTGFDPCDDCEYGAFSGKGQSQCCSIGSSLNNTNGKCEACSTGEKWASGICEACAAGSYTSDEGCVPAMK
jgi:hypothetical protein